jgi:hypothetical protein
LGRDVARPRLKAPRGQRPHEEQRPAADPIQIEPAELLYESYAAAKDYRTKGPGSEKLKFWHELAVKDREAWRRVARAFRIAFMAQEQISVPALAGRNEVGVYVMDNDKGTWRSSIEARDDATGIVRDMRDVVGNLFTALDADEQGET